MWKHLRRCSIASPTSPELPVAHGLGCMQEGLIHVAPGEAGSGLRRAAAATPVQEPRPNSCSRQGQCDARPSQEAHGQQ